MVWHLSLDRGQDETSNVGSNTPLTWFLTAAALLVTAQPLLASDSSHGTVLAMPEFDRRLDRAHANCASKDPEFSVGFYDCLDQAMEGIYIDSSTVRSRP